MTSHRFNINRFVRFAVGSVLLLALSGPVSGQTQRVVIGNTLRLSTVMTVPIEIVNDREITAVEIRLRPNPAVLTPVALRRTGRDAAALDVFGMTLDPDGSTRIIAVSSNPTTPLPPGSGTVFELDITERVGAPNGSITLNPEHIDLFSPDGNLLPVEGESGAAIPFRSARFADSGRSVGFDRLFNLNCCPDMLASAWSDMDGDGDEDLLETGSITSVWRNNGDATFDEIGSGMNVTDVNGYSISAAWGDYDNDGDPDAVILGQSGRRSILENRSGSLVDVTESLGIASQGGSAFSANWVDYDRDGYLDLYLSDGSLFHNVSGTAFEDVGPASGIGASPTSGTAWTDIDNDGDPDLVTTEHLFINDNGVFRDIFPSTGMQAGASFGGGVSIADFDNDGWMDIYMSRGTLAPASLYRNLAGVLFEDVSVRAGIDVSLAEDAAWADFNNDSDIDLFVARPTAPDDPYRLFRNNGGGSFTNLAPEAGIRADVSVATGSSDNAGKAASWADYNGDGKQDLLTSNVGPPPFLFTNLGDGLHLHWLQVSLEGTTSNRSAIGARVSVVTGNKTFIRELRGGSYRSQNSSVLSFGLDNADGAQRLIVSWPSGRVEETVGGSAADRRVHLVEGTLIPINVSAAEPPELPRAFTVYPVFPNPFRDVCHIRFDMPQPGRVIVDVFDVLGRRASRLLSEMRPAGRHALVWDGRIANGTRAAPGIYFIRVSAGRLQHTIRALRVR